MIKEIEKFLSSEDQDFMLIQCLIPPFAIVHRNGGACAEILDFQIHVRFNRRVMLAGQLR